jgi:homoserine O-acetyltransferase
MGGGMSEDRTQWHRVERFELELGAVLTGVEQAYRLEGRLNEARDNLVVVFHSLTGTPDVLAWWPEVVGPGRAVDTERYAVLCTNLLGSCYGTTRLPRGADGKPVAVTTRDMARLVGLLVDDLGARSVALATGGSLGGMVTLEWAATFPDRTRCAIAFAAPAAHTAQGIGWNHVQRRAIELAGVEGLALARMAAMLTYRTAEELEARFGRERRDDGRFQVQSYLDHQGEKLVRRMDPDAYLALIGAMDAHDVGRGRGGIVPALRAFRGRLVGVGIPGDLLYTDRDVRTWTQAVGAEYREIHSLHGHDAFLLEPAQVAAIVREALDTEATQALAPATRSGAAAPGSVEA